MLSEIYNEIREILKFEMKKWEPETVDEDPEDPYLYSTENFELNKYIDILYEFIPERLEFCDNHYREF